MEIPVIENLSLVAQLLIDRTKALVAIQELHPKEYASSGDEVYELNPRCGNCGTAFPCGTRRLADEALEVDHD